MKRKRLTLLGCVVLTLGAVLSALLWIAVALIAVRSCSRLDTLYVKIGQHSYSLESFNGKFCHMFFFGREIGPFESDIDWNWYTDALKDMSLLSNRRERFIELFTANPKRFLGLIWGPGDPSKKLSDVAKLVYILYVPAWFVLVVLSILPGVWFWRHRRWSSDQRRKIRRYLLLVCAIPIIIPVVFLFLAAINTHFLGPREKPLYGHTSHPVVWPKSDSNGVTLKVMTYNIWRGGAYKGAWRFEKPALVTDRIRRIGKLIREYNPDLVFLQEVVMESGPGSVNQTPILAETAGMHTWAFGEDVNQGLPFYRIIKGNAILSKLPLKVLTNQPMAVSRSFFQVGMWTPRTLWCKTHIGEQEVLLASIHLISSKRSFSPEQKSMQMRQILEFAEDRSAILAGDFNVYPNNQVIEQACDSGRFSAKLDGPATVKSNRPTAKIDYIFVPANWEPIEHKVIQTELADHLPVLSTYRISAVSDPNSEMPR